MSNSEVLNLRKAQLSKLQNIKNHLDCLLQKKLRLEIEIRSLQKSYKKKTKEFQNSQKSLKLNVALENTSGNNPTQEEALVLEQIYDLDGQIAQEVLAISEMFEQELKQYNLDSFIKYCESMLIESEDE